MPDFFQGADAEVERLHVGTPIPLDPIRPSERFVMQRRIMQMRFSMKDGPYTPGLPFRIQGFSAMNRGLFPQDVMGSVLQSLFPCPDGVILLPNQIYSDTLSRLSAATLGRTLRILHTETGDLESQIIQVISPGTSTETLNALAKNFDTLARHDLGFRVARAVQTFFNTHEDDLNDPDPDFANDTVLAFHSDQPITAMVKCLKKHLGSLPFEEGELEDYRNHLNVRDIPADSPYALYAQHREAFDVMFFARALAQEHKNSDGYPPHFLTQILTTFMWLKATSMDDVSVFYGELFNVIPEQLSSAFARSYSHEDYVTLRERMKAGQGPFSREDIALATRGFEIYESPYLALVEFRSANYTPKTKSRLKGQSFSDCVETALRNILIVAARIEGENGLEQNFAALGLTADALAALEPDPLLLYGQAAHNRWGSYTTEFEGVGYAKPNNSGRLKYEMRPGIFNSLLLLAHAFGDKARDLVSALNAIDLDAEDFKLQPALNALGTLISTPERSVRLECEYDPDFYPPYNDVLGKIILSINGKKVLTWTHEAMHVYVTYCAESVDDWRTRVDTSILHRIPMQMYFTPAEKLVETLAPLIDKDFFNAFWSIDLNKRDNWIPLIKGPFAHHQDECWKSIIPVVMKRFKELGDHDTNTLLERVLYDEITDPELSPERREVLLTVIRHYRQILYNIVDNGETLAGVICQQLGQRGESFLFENLRKATIKSSDLSAKYVKISDTGEQTAIEAETQWIYRNISRFARFSSLQVDMSSEDPQEVMAFLNHLTSVQLPFIKTLAFPIRSCTALTDGFYKAVKGLICAAAQKNQHVDIDITLDNKGAIPTVESNLAHVLDDMAPGVRISIE